MLRGQELQDWGIVSRSLRAWVGYADLWWPAPAKATRPRSVRFADTVTETPAGDDSEDRNRAVIMPTSAMELFETAIDIMAQRTDPSSRTNFGFLSKEETAVRLARAAERATDKPIWRRRAGVVAVAVFSAQGSVIHDAHIPNQTIFTQHHSA